MTDIAPGLRQTRRLDTLASHCTALLQGLKRIRLSARSQADMLPSRFDDARAAADRLALHSGTRSGPW